MKKIFLSVLLVLAVFVGVACNSGGNADYNAPLIRTSYDRKYVCAGDSVRLPEIRVTDSDDIPIEYRYAVRFGGEEVKVENGTFLAEEPGEYTLTIGANAGGENRKKTVKIFAGRQGWRGDELVADFSSPEYGTTVIEAALGMTKGYTEEVAYKDERGSTFLTLGSELHRPYFRFYNLLPTEYMESFSYIYFYIYNGSSFTKNLSFSSNPGITSFILQPQEWNLVYITEEDIEGKFGGALDGGVISIFQSANVDGLDAATFYFSDMYAVPKDGLAERVEEEFSDLPAVVDRDNLEITDCEMERARLLYGALTAEEQEQVSPAALARYRNTEKQCLALNNEIVAEEVEELKEHYGYTDTAEERMHKIIYFDSEIGSRQVSVTGGTLSRPGDFVGQSAPDGTPDDMLTKLTISGGYESKVTFTLPAIQDLSDYREMYVYLYLEDGTEGAYPTATFKNGNEGTGFLGDDPAYGMYNKNKWLRISIDDFSSMASDRESAGKESVVGATLRFYNWNGIGACTIYMTPVYAQKTTYSEEDFEILYPEETGKEQVAHYESSMGLRQTTFSQNVDGTIREATFKYSIAETEYAVGGKLFSGALALGANGGIYSMNLTVTSPDLPEDIGSYEKLVFYVKQENASSDNYVVMFYGNGYSVYTTTAENAGNWNRVEISLSTINENGGIGNFMLSVCRTGWNNIGANTQVYISPMWLE